MRRHTAAMKTLSVLLLSVHLTDGSVTDIERQFLDVPSAETARESLKFLTSKPHVAGTPGDHEMSQYVHDRFVTAGIPDVEIQAVNALLSSPIESSLELVNSSTGNVMFSASLSEDILDQDTTSDTWYRNHTYNGYSPSGDVTASLVYVNYGMPQDFDALEEMGVSVEGAIVIARYGDCFRGLKVMNAQERGAVGVIIYSDPSLDGFSRGKTYPDGSWRPASGVQRGSVLFISKCAGDPSRAGSEHSVEEICGLSQDELVPSIPVIPISHRDAEPLLRALGGEAAPDNFQGGLDFEYTVGPSGPSTAVRLRVENEEHVGPIWNVIGVIPGSLPTEQDRPIVLGNHRDAWIFGAVDPNSGTSSLIEVARGLGQLLESGWRPLRTIVLCSWSGEELGMIGSTAWGETNAEGILAKAAAYLNIDSAVSGSILRLKSSPSLLGLVRGVMEDVEDPNSGQPLLDVWSGDAQVLGAGSDYVVFLDNLGIPSVDFEFQSDPLAEYGVYHSIYDSFSWMTMYGDPGFGYFKASAQVWGLMALRLSDSEVLPFDPRCQATAIEFYLDELRRLVNEQLGATFGSFVSDTDLTPLTEAVGAFRAAADSIELPPEYDHGCGVGKADGDMGDKVSDLPVEALKDARAAIMRGSSRVGSSRVGVTIPGAGGVGLAEAPDIEDLNERLAMTERRFLSEGGLPGRPWFRHILQAPGIYLGYDAQTFPGITQALQDGDEELALKQIDVAAACVNDAADFLSSSST